MSRWTPVDGGPKPISGRPASRSHGTRKRELSQREMRLAPAVHLDPEAEAELHKLIRRRTTPVRAVERCRIVLLAAAGLQDKQIAERLSVAPAMAVRWRCRFLAQGVTGLLQDAPRPGRTPTITAAKVAEIVAKTTQAPPPHTTQWLRSTMAIEAGISESSVGRIWRTHGLKPLRVERGVRAVIPCAGGGGMSIRGD